MIEKLIKSKLEDYIKLISENNVQFKESIIIDNAFFASELDDKKEIKKKSKRVEDILNEHKNIPILYWFSFNEIFNKQKELRQDYEPKYKEIQNLLYSNIKEDYKDNNLKFRKAMSSFKTNYDENSKVLYVGKVEKGIWGRLAVHSGWGSSPKTAGLQLRHWYNFKKYGDLTFNYIILDKNMKYFASVLESELRNELKPLLGKK
jgi:DNA-binding ferritin-like protein (Dps family)